jgi:hypothetical protein
MRTPAAVVACVALACVTFFYFPGHTWLQQDSQVYAPILEHLRDPSLLRNELLAAKPHVAYTLYDEAALGLSALTGAGLEHVLAAEQLAARAFGIWGLYLLALAALGPEAGQRRALAWLVAALCSLGALAAGPEVLTIEYEPTPRAFALPLALCAAGYAAHRRWLGAGLASAAAFLFHPPTMAPVWAVALGLAAWRGERKRRDWLLVLAPVAVAAAALLLFARAQEGSGEAQAFLARLAPWLEQLQRMRASYNWISTWPAAVIWHHCIVFAILLVAVARVWRDTEIELRALLLALPSIGLLSMPASWFLLERMRWALLPQVQPMRNLLFGVLFMQLAAALAGARAALKGRNPEAWAWFAVAILPAAQPVLTQPYKLRAVAAVAASAALAWAAAYWGGRRAPAAVALAAGAFVLLPLAGGVVNYPDLHNAGLAQLSAWARTDTPKDAVFLFADSGKKLDAGIFRAEAQRAVYVDWKGGGQVNYLRGFAEQWWFRWRETLGRGFREADLPKYNGLGIRYVALRGRLARPAVFENSRYAVYDLGSEPRPSAVAPGPNAPLP